MTVYQQLGKIKKALGTSIHFFTILPDGDLALYFEDRDKERIMFRGKTLARVLDAAQEYVDTQIPKPEKTAEASKSTDKKSVKETKKEKSETINKKGTKEKSKELNEEKEQNARTLEEVQNSSRDRA